MATLASRPALCNFSSRAMNLLELTTYDGGQGRAGGSIRGPRRTQRSGIQDPVRRGAQDNGVPPSPPASCMVIMHARAGAGRTFSGVQ